MAIDYSDAELEAQYNNQKRVPEFPQLVEQWRRRSAGVQSAAACRLDLAYGEGPRDRFDYYACGQQNAPLLIYLHGGYWQAGDKSLYGFLTPGPVAAGFNVAIPNYPLCPDAALENITPQLTRLVAHLYNDAPVLGFDRERMVLSGHSAGGHLTAMLLAADFSQLQPRLPAGPFRSGISISGLYDLAPLIPTSINTALGLDIDRARKLSPIYMKAASDTPLLACAGTLESEEFHRQARGICHAWDPLGEYLAIPASNHFTVLESLSSSSGALCARLHDLAVL